MKYYYNNTKNSGKSSILLIYYVCVGPLMTKNKNCMNCGHKNHDVYESKFGTVAQGTIVLGTYLAGHPVNLCLECEIKIFNQTLGKTDRQIERMFW